jgi:ubiquinone biosynthesis protein COQ9
MSDSEPNSTSLTIAIQLHLKEAARLRKLDPTDKRIKKIMLKVSDLAVARMNLKVA